MKVNKEINSWKTKKGATSVILGCDAQVEFQPNQEPLAECGLWGGKTKNLQHSNREMQLEAAFWELLRQEGLATDTLPFGQSRLQADCEHREQLKRWKAIDYVSRDFSA